jgi:hypothetical protein
VCVCEVVCVCVCVVVVVVVVAAVVVKSSFFIDSNGTSPRTHASFFFCQACCLDKWTVFFLAKLCAPFLQEKAQGKKTAYNWAVS